MTMNAHEIRSAALAYNAAYPEAAAQIAAGEPIIHVYAETDAHSGRRLRLVRDAGIVAPDGGFISAGNPEPMHMTTPRYGVEKAALWYGRKIAGDGVRVEIRMGR